MSIYVKSILRPHVMFGDKYYVIKELSAGGMGIVWLGRDRSGGLVAIKEPRIIPNDKSSTVVNIKKIRHEAKILRKVRSKNIVNLLDAYEILELPKDVKLPRECPLPVVLVLEYIDGLNIRDHERRFGFSESEVTNIMSQLCDAVDILHRNNIIHRDIKPKNVLLTSNKIVKLIDFGTCRYYFNQPTSREAVFSPKGYTAPEQVKFMATPQSDIWSLGAILFMMVTGRDPIEDLPGYPNNVERPPDPRKFNKDVDHKIVKIIQKAMNPNPSLRYMTVAEFKSDLLGRPVAPKEGAIELIIRGEAYHIDSDAIVIGRGDDPSRDVEIVNMGDYVMVRVYDPYHYISRVHCKIYRLGKTWYIKDLGSLNKTAVYDNESGWNIIHKGYKVESDPYRLGSRNLISIVYDDRKGPYLQVVVVTER